MESPCRLMPIQVEISCHHVHLSQEHADELFGKGYDFGKLTDLSQKGQYACRERVKLLGPEGQVNRVRIVAPPRERTQIEITRSDQDILGIDAPVRDSGNVTGSPGIVIVRLTKQSIKITEGVIRAVPHIHMTPADAERFGLQDRTEVRVRLSPLPKKVLVNALVRIRHDYQLRMHIDSDEAREFGFITGMNVFAHVLRIYPESSLESGELGRLR